MAHESYGLMLTQHPGETVKKVHQRALKAFRKFFVPQSTIDYYTIYRDAALLDEPLMRRLVSFAGRKVAEWDDDWGLIASVLDVEADTEAIVPQQSWVGTRWFVTIDAHL